MGTRALVPDLTISSIDWTVPGGGTFHGSQADNNDSTYVAPNNMANPTPLAVHFSAVSPALPAGSRITAVTLVLRRRFQAAGVAFLYGRVGIDGDGEHAETNYGVPGSGSSFQDASVTWTHAPDGTEWEEAELDALYSLIRGPGTLASPFFSNLHIAEQDVTVTYNERPVVTVDYPVDDDTTTAGNQVTTTSTPSAGWTYVDPETDPQERWEVRRYEQPAGGWTGFDPDSTSETPVETRTGVGTGTSTQMSEVLDNNTTYRDYVRAADTTPSGFAVRWSAWAFREFTVALVPPPGPGITVTPESSANRVEIELTEGPDPSTTITTPNAEYFDVERSEDGGETWNPIRFSPVDGYSVALMADDPDAYWRMSDNTDETLNAPNLNVVPTSATPYVAGGIGSAAHLNGTTEYLRHGLGFDPPMTGAWQVRSLVKFDTLAASQRVFHKGTTTAVDVALGVDATGKPLVLFTDTTGTVRSLTSATALVVNTWYVLRGTWDGTTLRLYVDGVDTGTSLAPATGPRDTGNEMRLGRGTDTDPFLLDGWLDETAVYSSNIAPARIAEVDSPVLTIVVYDYEALRSADGTDQPVVYRAHAVDTSEGLPIASGWVESASVVLASDGMQWIKSTSDPSLNRTFDIVAEGSPATIDSTSDEPQGVFYAQGRSDPVVHSADIQMERFEFLVSLDDDDDREDFEALRALQETLLVQLCTGDDGLEQHYVRFGGPRLWQRIIEETAQNTAQKAWYRIPATEVRGSL